ncbi:MAG TPA: hypothetical protein VGM03_11195 [Phycisphaerae bacterium]
MTASWRGATGQASRPSPHREKIERLDDWPVGRKKPQDLLRLVQTLNGVNTTQVFNGATVAACP